MQEEINIKRNKNISGKVLLPASKSISNRALIIQALSSKKIEINNLSTADDTLCLKNILKSKRKVNDAGNAGTAMRFLLSYFSITEGEFLLTGSERMKERPIGPLVSTLKKLGADIFYEEKEGFPPLRIKGKNLKGGELSINAGVSSQFISSLMLTAPYFEQGLLLKLEGDIVSEPYIKMTSELMHQCGVKTEASDRFIRISPQEYSEADIIIESDWSAASYFYELAAFTPDSKVVLTGLNQSSIQGDAIVREIFTNFGVETVFSNKGAIIQNTGSCVSHFDYDFTNCPDLAQTVAFTMAGLGIKGKLSELKSLKIKETNRINTVYKKIRKTGIKISENTDFIEILSEGIKSPDTAFESYDDHRMAMAAAPLALILGEIKIKNPGVVSKSFPQYWEQLENTGLLIST